MDRKEPQPIKSKDQVEGSLRRLRRSVVGLVVAWVATIGWLALVPRSTPEVLAVERLDIVEPNGELAIVLANSQRPVAATGGGEVIMPGQEAERRGTPSIIFFDGKGDEVGGMLFGVRETDDGYRATRHFSFDAYKQDQSVVIHHYQDTDGARTGLAVIDRPERPMVDFFTEIGLEPPFSRAELEAAIAGVSDDDRRRLEEDFASARRVFVGSDEDNNAMLALMDPRGRPRIVLNVSAEGDPSVQVLDEEGTLMWELPTP